MITIVYDPYSIESVITTAVVYRRYQEKILHILPFNSTRFYPNPEWYYVLCDYQHKHIKAPRREQELFEALNIDNTERSVDDGIVPSLIRLIAEQDGDMPLFTLANFIDCFKKRNHFKEILLQTNEPRPASRIKDHFQIHAIVYANYKAAVKCLADYSDFEPIIYRDGTEYYDFVKTIKGRMQHYLKIYPTLIKDKTIRVPFMHVSTYDGPWIKSFLEPIFPYGYLYELSGENLFILSWNRNSKLENHFTKMLRDQLPHNFKIIMAGNN